MKNNNSTVASTWMLILIFFLGCTATTEKKDETDPSTESNENLVNYPSEIISELDQWSITMGDGSTVRDLIDYENSDYFYSANDGSDWVVFKTPNSGGTTPNSNNTRSELRHLPEWVPTQGGKMSATLKVMHVSTSGDARVAASHSVVVGQIHSSEGHSNEPLKIFYKKFPDHEKGSVFWNYEINTKGDNSGRWDYSSAVWGHDMSVIGSEADSSPSEPEDGIVLGEEFSYEINVFEGVMYLKFFSEGHSTKTFTKSLISSDYVEASDIPEQVLTLYADLGRDGVEVPNAYESELQYFKLGAYNQTNGKIAAENIVWSTESDIYEGDLLKQYENGSYAEVWVREAKTGPGTAPNEQ